MSKFTIIEEVSADATERHIASSAVRILNDTSLNRQQREKLIQKLQLRLIEYRQKAAQAPLPKPRRPVPQQSGADPKAVQTRRREQHALSASNEEPIIEPASLLASSEIPATRRTAATLTLRRPH